MYKVKIERTQGDEKPLSLSVTNFLEKLKEENESYLSIPGSMTYSNRDNSYDEVKWLVNEFNERQDKKAKKKGKFNHKYPKLICGSGSSHIWIHIEGDSDRVAILNEV